MCTTQEEVREEIKETHQKTNCRNGAAETPHTPTSSPTLVQRQDSQAFDGHMAPAAKCSPRPAFSPAGSRCVGRNTTRHAMAGGSSHVGHRGASPIDDDTAAFSAWDHPPLGCQVRGKNFSPNLWCSSSGNRNHSRSQKQKGI